MTMVTRHRKSYLDGDIEAAIETMAVDGWTPAQISKELHRQEQFMGRVPEDRTIQRRVAALQARDASGAWSVADATTRDARLILDTLAAVIEHTAGRVLSLTRSEAAWVARIYHAAPELHPLWRWRLARLYRLREAHHESVADLDAMLAFAPWREGAKQRYDKAVRAGWVAFPPRVASGAEATPAADLIDVDALLTADRAERAKWELLRELLYRGHSDSPDAAREWLETLPAERRSIIDNTMSEYRQQRSSKARSNRRRTQRASGQPEESARRGSDGKS
jgi:hypothetical protein